MKGLFGIHMTKTCALLMAVLMAFSQTSIAAYAKETIITEGVLPDEAEEVAGTEVADEGSQEVMTDVSDIAVAAEETEVADAADETEVADAADETEVAETAEETEVADAAETADETEVVEAADEAKVAMEAVGFEYSQTVDDVDVFVSAPAGVFPEGTTLEITKVDDDVQEAIDGSIDEVREARNVVASYTFDITFFNTEGEEIEPDTEYGKVSVFFNLAEATDDMNDVSVYHTYENGDVLETEVIENVSVESETGVVECEELEGFSYYTVEFTYGGELRYVLGGDDEVELAAILEACELSDKGEVTAAVSSNEELFKAENRDGIWWVVSLQSFESEESLVVTMGGSEYTIVVTDPESGTFTELQEAIIDAVLNAQSAGWTSTSLELDKDYVANAGEDAIVINFNITIDLKGHMIDRQLSEATDNGYVIKVNCGTVTINDTSTGQTGKITGGNSTGYGGGVYVESGSKLVLEGGSISENKCNYSGGGVFVNHSGEFVMNGGNITGNEAAFAGGGVAVCGDASGSEAKFKFDDGEIANNTARGVCGKGGGVYVDTGRFEMTGGNIKNNLATSFNPIGPSASGGGVYVYLSTFIMTGGIISDNTKSDNMAGSGGGVSVISSNTTIGGSASIKDNKIGTVTDNLYVGSAITFSPLADDAYIGISPESSLKTFSTNVPSANADKVVSDNPSTYVVKRYTDAGVEKLQLVEPYISFKELQQLITNASDGETINLTCNCNYDSAVDGEPDYILIDKKIIIDLKGHKIDRKLTGASAVSNGYIFQITGEEITIENGTLTGGNNATNGGAIIVKSNGKLHLDNVTITQNAVGSGYDGGAISCEYNAWLKATKCTFSNNKAGRHGGAINMNCTKALFTECTFSNNTVSVNGGAIVFGGGSNIVFSECIFTQNNANMGGAIFGFGDDSSNLDKCWISDCEFTSNSAGTGGVVYAWNNTELKAESSEFTSNTAQYSGAAVANYNSNVTLNNVVIKNNKSDGGALYVATNGMGATTTVLKGEVIVDQNTKLSSSVASDLYMMSANGVLDVSNLSSDSKIGVADVYEYPKKAETIISGALPSGYVSGRVFSTKSGCSVMIKDNKLIWVVESTPEPSPTPEPDDDTTENSSNEEPAQVVALAETGLTVARYVGSTKLEVPFVTGNTSQAGWGTINNVVAAHKAANGNKPLNVTMNGYATVDNTLLKKVNEQKVDLALNLDNNVTVVVPKQNNVIKTALNTAGANNDSVYFKVSALTQKNVPEVAGHTTGLNFTDVQAIGGTSSTPVVKVVCSNTVNSFARTKSIQIVFDTNTIKDDNGKKIYAPGQRVYLYNGSRTAGVNCYLSGTVGKDGKVVFTVPMVNSYWTIGTKNLGGSRLRR